MSTVADGLKEGTNLGIVLFSRTWAVDLGLDEDGCLLCLTEEVSVEFGRAWRFLLDRAMQDV